MDRLTAAGPGFRAIPRTGVIYVMTEAARRGYQTGHPQWANLGQGAPETGGLPGAPPRIDTVHIAEADHEYAPVDGLPELKDAVAALYNARYRQGKASQYTRDNVAISAGGRAGLTRVVGVLGRTNVGHFLPDYTAYEELLDTFGTFSPIPVLLDPARHYAFTPDELRDEILGRGLGAILLSNPCNPTGTVLRGTRLAAWVRTCRELGCTLIVDEFYSHYVYNNAEIPGQPAVPTLSAAAAVDDVDEDPVVIIDGLTKNWRYPGRPSRRWRARAASWTAAARARCSARRSPCWIRPSLRRRPRPCSAPSG